MELPVEIHFNIMEHLSLPDLEMLGATNSFFRTLVQQHAQHRTTKLFRFFEIDPISMLDVLNLTGSVVSGSAALVVVNPWSFTPNDMDIYAPPTRSALLIELMATRFGYIVDAIAVGYPQFSGISAIHTLKKGVHSVQVMVTSSENPLTAVFHFHSTTVMNFISAHGIYCAYPILTSQRRGLKNRYELAHNGQSEEAVRLCLDKYAQRGYEIADDLSGWPEFDGHACTSNGSCPAVKRCVDDRYAYFHLFGKVLPENRPNRVFISGIDRPVWSLVGPVTSFLNNL